MAKTKPHIFYRDGYWRVSPKPKPYHRHDKLWDAAHEFIRRLNTPEFKFAPGDLNGQGFYQMREAIKLWGRVTIVLSQEKIDRVLSLIHASTVLRGKSLKRSERSKALNLMGLGRMVHNVYHADLDSSRSEVYFETNFLNIPKLNLRLVTGYED